MKLSKEFIAMFREEAKKSQWEINSWNGKSIDDLVVDYLEHKELKPEDFTEAVILTIEEAKEIAFKLKELSEGYFLETGNIDSRSVEWSIVLNERIEQAKGYIPINNASFIEGKLILPKQAEVCNERT